MSTAKRHGNARLKGVLAEIRNPFPRIAGWDTLEYSVYCHRFGGVLSKIGFCFFRSHPV